MTNKVYLDVLSFLVPNFNQRTADAVSAIFPNLGVTDANVYGLLLEAEKSPMFQPEIYKTIVSKRSKLPCIRPTPAEALVELFTWDKNIVPLIPAFLLSQGELDYVMALVTKYTTNHLVADSIVGMSNLRLVVTYDNPNNTNTIGSGISSLGLYVKNNKPLDSRDKLTVVLENALVGLKNNIAMDVILNQLADHCKQYQQLDNHDTTVPSLATVCRLYDEALRTHQSGIASHSEPMINAEQPACASIDAATEPGIARSVFVMIPRIKTR